MTVMSMVRFEDLYDPSKVITNSNPINKNEFSEDGIFSTVIFGEENDSDNLDTVGWIDLGDNYVISPLMYSRLAKLMKQRVLDSIIQFNKSINRDGNFVDDVPEPGSRMLIFEDSNIGLKAFKDRFLELLQKYTDVEKKDSPEYRNMVRWYIEDKIFTSKLPVFSPKLRPAQLSKEDKTFQFSEINSYYNFIVNYAEMVKSIKGSDTLEEVQLRKLKLMAKLQEYVNSSAELVLDFIKGKRGTIRKNILAGRVNFSSRSVIVPGPNLAINEIEISYRAFMELYKLPLINLIVRTEGITHLEAKAYLNKNNNRFVKRIYNYMNELIKNTKGGIKAILNRNPSISVYSIGIMTIVGVTADPENYTMSVSNLILAGLGADYDGDVLNLIALFGEKQYQQFHKMDPYNQSISVNDGLFNRTASLDKDPKVAVYLLSNPNADDITYNIID